MTLAEKEKTEQKEKPGLQKKEELIPTIKMKTTTYSLNNVNDLKVLKEKYAIDIEKLDVKKIFDATHLKINLDKRNNRVTLTLLSKQLIKALGSFDGKNFKFILPEEKKPTKNIIDK
ncbi:MAG: hypothetical protein N3E37_01355 [Candidatus Micrarchaeota archaeon]|nr:hypothetical protein [Candidatus Micrarchaeota archaeon]